MAGHTMNIGQRKVVTWACGKPPPRLGGFGYVGSLRAFLTLDNLEFDLVAFLQALVSLNCNCAVVNEDIRAVIPADEPVSLRIVEPLDGSFHAFHVRPPLLRSPRNGVDPEISAKCVGIVLRAGCTVKELGHMTGCRARIKSGNS
jgi:hypothetical protein